MRFAMKKGQNCFSLRKFLAISSAIQKSLTMRLRCPGALNSVCDMSNLSYTAGIRRCEATNLGVFDLCHFALMSPWTNGAAQIRVGLALADFRNDLFSLGNGANTVSESTVSNTELGELFGPHRVPERDLSEFLSAYYLCAHENSPSCSQNSASLPQNSVSLSESQWVLLSETVLSKQYSARFLLGWLKGAFARGCF